MDEKELKPIKAIAQWLLIASYSFLALIIIIDIYANSYGVGLTDTFNVGVAVGSSFWTLVGGLINIACGKKNAKWALKIKRSMNIAYIIGFVFGLLGLLGYWIYYKVQLRIKGED